MVETASCIGAATVVTGTAVAGMMVVAVAPVEVGTLADP